MDRSWAAERITGVRVMSVSLCAALSAVIALICAPSAGSAASRQIRLPAPITVQAGKGTFEIARDGHVARVPPRLSPYPRDAAVFPSGVWYVIRHGHLQVGHGPTTLWRSRGAFPSYLQFGVVTVGEGTVAFSYRRGGSEDLYVARLGREPERRVARGEFPLGWTSDGFFTYRYHGRELRFRNGTGTLLATLVHGVPSYAYDPTGGRLYFVSRDRVFSAAGPTRTPIARLGAIGLRARPFPALIPADGLVQLLGSNRLVLLRPDGSLFANARIDLSRENISSSSLAIAPGGTAVAYTVVSGTKPAAGAETVYVLSAGAHAAGALYRQPIHDGGCERGAGVQWHAHWLLYTTSEGYLMVLDSTGRHRAVDLGPIVRSLPGHPGRISAYWTGQAPSL
jgi:hypothetical protein